MYEKAFLKCNQAKYFYFTNSAKVLKNVFSALSTSKIKRGLINPHIVFDLRLNYSVRFTWIKGCKLYLWSNIFHTYRMALGEILKLIPAQIGISFEKL